MRVPPDRCHGVGATDPECHAGVVPVGVTSRESSRLFPCRPQDCCSYVAGHHIHVIQWSHSYRREDRPWRPARIGAVGADGWFEVVVDGREYRRWTHDPERLARVLAERTPDDEIGANLGWSIVRVGRTPVSVTSDPVPCVTDPPRAGLAAALVAHGGFLVPGSVALTLESLQDAPPDGDDAGPKGTDEDGPKGTDEDGRRARFAPPRESGPRGLDEGGCP